MNSIRLNTAFIPPEEVSEKVIELSKAIGGSSETYFVLDGIQFYPHITIYPPEYPGEKVSEVLETVEQVSKSFSPIKFKYSRIGSLQGYVGISLENTLEIKAIHQQIVEALNPLREGRIREKYSEYQMQFTTAQLKNIEGYGYPDAMNLYDPHLTITRLKDEDKLEEAISAINWDILEFIVDKIGVYKSGEHGTCRELVKEFNLDGYNS